jgi:hypothetical protein
MYRNVFRKSRLYELRRKNIVEPDRPQMTMWRTSIACWVTKAKHTHTQYVILITYPLQQWLHERASVLLYKYIVCHVTKLRIKKIK